jgi:hypothetical protein
MTEHHKAEVEADLEHLERMFEMPIEDISDPTTRELLVQHLQACFAQIQTSGTREQKFRLIGEVVRHAYVLGRWSTLI